MVARIASEPISTQLAVSEFRTRQSDVRANSEKPASPLPPVPEPVPTPVPAPAVVSPGEAFAAALLAEDIETRPSAVEMSLRQPTGWQVPDSALRLADISV
jgi:hypothetical protein